MTSCSFPIMQGCRTIVCPYLPLRKEAEACNWISTALLLASAYWGTDWR
jgi:hypothetical protein